RSEPQVGSAGRRPPSHRFCQALSPAPSEASSPPLVPRRNVDSGVSAFGVVDSFPPHRRGRLLPALHPVLAARPSPAAPCSLLRRRLYFRSPLRQSDISPARRANRRPRAGYL